MMSKVMKQVCSDKSYLPTSMNNFNTSEVSLGN
jgi:hypothetical protein